MLNNWIKGMRSRKILTGIYSVGVTGVAAAVVSVVIYLNQQPMTGFPFFIASFTAGSKLYFFYQGESYVSILSDFVFSGKSCPRFQPDLSDWDPFKGFILYNTRDFKKKITNIETNTRDNDANDNTVHANDISTIHIEGNRNLLPKIRIFWRNFVS